MEEKRFLEEATVAEPAVCRLFRWIPHNIRLDNFHTARPLPKRYSIPFSPWRINSLLPKKFGIYYVLTKIQLKYSYKYENNFHSYIM
jgi:hypothetical protein